MLGRKKTTHFYLGLRTAASGTWRVGLRAQLPNCHMEARHWVQNIRKKQREIQSGESQDMAWVEGMVAVEDRVND